MSNYRYAAHKPRRILKGHKVTLLCDEEIRRFFQHVTHEKAKRLTSKPDALNALLEKYSKLHTDPLVERAFEIAHNAAGRARYAWKKRLREVVTANPPKEKTHAIRP
jgi:hypothetical protein